ncbi:hypothetical protein IFM89_025749 [Coptis chinensis]|uniref:Uncharacterized protein n=1 Tax=Coptis chinensis TaxID=261450 RepID=A0A835GXW3_9MAGN|nr:hypothetical protein IFM89_025749 [Coptis chinensis]
MLPIAAVTPSMYYHGGGFFPSLATFQSFNQQPQINVGEEFGAASNLALLQGFGHLPFQTQQMQHHAQQQQHHHEQQVQQQQQQSHLHLHQHDFNLGISSTSSGLEEKVIQPNRPSTSHQDWSQNFNTTTPPITSESSYWSSNTSSNTNATTINTTSTTTPSTTVSLNPTHWTDHLQGYGPPPSTTATTSSSPPSFL